MTDTINSYQEVINRVWADETFKNRFITEPKAILAEIGASVPDSVQVEVHQDEPNVQNFVLLAKEQLEKLNLQAAESIFSQVLRQAVADNTLKTRLIENPKAVIQEITGQNLPESLNICVYEDTPTVKHLVIPINPNSEELSDLELEMVAGGKRGTTSGMVYRPQTQGSFGSWY